MSKCLSSGSVESESSVDLLDPNTEPFSPERLELHRRAAFRVARCVLTPFGKAAQAAADEVADDALSRAFEKYDQFNPYLSFSAWISGIARNLAIDWVRQSRRHRHLPLQESSADCSDSDSLVRAEQMAEVRSRLHQAVAELPERDRTLFRAFYGHGAAISELALSTGLAPRTVRCALSRSKSHVLGRLGGVYLTNAELRSAYETFGPI